MYDSRLSISMSHHYIRKRRPVEIKKGKNSTNRVGRGAANATRHHPRPFNLRKHIHMFGLSVYMHVRLEVVYFNGSSSIHGQETAIRNWKGKNINNRD